MAKPKNEETAIAIRDNDGAFSMVGNGPPSLADFALEQVVKLEEGQSLHGRLLGEGGAIETTDENTGEIGSLKTWRIASLKNDKVVAVLVGSHQLNTAFPGKVGKEVVVRREGQTNTRKGRRVNVYSIFYKD